MPEQSAFDPIQCGTDSMFTGSKGPAPVSHPPVLYKSPSYSDDSTALEQPVASEPQIEYATGYPFMQLAKRHGVDYGDVLSVADDWDLYHRFGYHKPLPALKEISVQRLKSLPEAALIEIDGLMRLPVHLRGAAGHDVV